MTFQNNYDQMETSPKHKYFLSLQRADERSVIITVGSDDAGTPGRGVNIYE